MRKAVTILASLLGLCLIAGAQNGASLLLKRTIALPFATGRFDHMAYDAESNRLFVAATGNHSVEVLDIKTSERAETIAGLGKPHGLAWIPREKKLFVSDGTLAALKVYSGSPLKEVASLPLSDDADDMVYDAQTGWLYVGHGGSSASVPGRVAVVDTRTNTLLENLPVSAHPEALERDEHGKRIFVNVADAGEIVVIDGATHAEIATWKLTRAKDNVPVAFAEDKRALLVGCRSPARKRRSL
jgi:DNA-binding beta-propeller fold protein YncE